MKRLLKVIVALCLSGYSYAQTIEKLSIDSGGASVNTGGIEILYTIGEVNTQEVNTGGVSISEGFIGSDFNSNTLNVPTFEENSILVYPNPVKNKLRLISNHMIDKISIIDINGRMLNLINISKTDYSLNVSNLSKGVYFLEIQSGQSKPTKKFIKN